MRKKSWTSDDGSIVIGLMLVMVIAMVATSLTALLVYQSASLIAKQRTAEARQAAYNAYVLSTQALATASPDSMTGIPTSAPNWNGTEISNVRNRWWVTTADDANIVVHAEGRSGPITGRDADAATRSAYIVDLTYDFSVNTWKVTAIRPAGSAS